MHTESTSQNSENFPCSLTSHSRTSGSDGDSGRALVGPAETIENDAVFDRFGAVFDRFGAAERFRNFAERFRNRSAKFRNRSAAPKRSKTAPKRSKTASFSIVSAGPTSARPESPSEPEVLEWDVKEQGKFSEFWEVLSVCI